MREAIREIKYLVRHSTGITPTAKHLVHAIYELKNNMSPLDISNALIILIHEDSKKYRPNPNIHSYDW